MSPVNSAPPDAFDELAGLFLTEDQPSTGKERERQRPDHPRIEVLLTGHLPVRGGVWLAPYADAVARDSHQCAALVRLDGDEPTIEIMRGEADAMPRGRSSFRETIANLTRCAGTWLIRSPLELEAHETSDSEADRVTILSGADGAAVVAAYQAVKSLATAARDRNLAPPSMALAVLGADDSAAARTHERVSQTALSQLGVSVEQALPLPRIEGGHASSWRMAFAGEPIPRTAEVINWIRAASRSKSPTAVVPGTSHVGPASRTDARPEELPQSRWRLVREEPIDSDDQRWRDGDHARGAPPPTDYAGRRKLMPKPSVIVESKTPPATMPKRDAAGADAEARLVAHVDGLTGIRPRCPGFEHIELAVDAVGSLHLLGREAALRDLHIVEAWADRHRELLAMAAPNSGLHRHGAIHCHLFTDRPVGVADLHPTDLHLHVLAPVQVGDQTGWYSAPLNR